MLSYNLEDMFFTEVILHLLMYIQQLIYLILVINLSFSAFNIATTSLSIMLKHSHTVLVHEIHLTE